MHSIKNGALASKMSGKLSTAKPHPSSGKTQPPSHSHQGSGAVSFNSVLFVFLQAFIICFVYFNCIYFISEVSKFSMFAITITIELPNFWKFHICVWGILVIFIPQLQPSLLPPQHISQLPSFLTLLTKYKCCPCVHDCRAHPLGHGQVTLLAHQPSGAISSPVRGGASWVPPASILWVYIWVLDMLYPEDSIS